MAPDSPMGGVPTPVRRSWSVDLRSDTVSPPTAAMLNAMLRADVGEDAWGEDPSVNALEAFAAHLAQKEAALYCPSVTMGNIVCVLAQAPRGSGVVAHHDAHILGSERGACCTFGGLTCHSVPGADGTLDLDALDEQLQRAAQAGHEPIRVVSVENTHLRAGGVPVPTTHLEAIRVVCEERGARLHMDGARAWNAVGALNTSLALLLAPCDSAALSLCKGLGAPTGAVVVGQEVTVARARTFRKLLGGGQHQSGFAASAGLVALRDMRDRLGDDHARAQRLARELRSLPRSALGIPSPATNVVLIDVSRTGRDAPWWDEALAAHGVRLKAQSAKTLRAITHIGIADDHIDVTVAAFATVAALA